MLSYSRTHFFNGHVLECGHYCVLDCIVLAAEVALTRIFFIRSVVKSSWMMATCASTKEINDRTH